jgi:hypothetical protein
MGQFFKATTKPVEPVLDLYEADYPDEPYASIDYAGQLWLKVGGPSPKVLFADVPVRIHTRYGFLIAPIDEIDN